MTDEKHPEVFVHAGLASASGKVPDMVVPEDDSPGEDPDTGKKD